MVSVFFLSSQAIITKTDMNHQYLLGFDVGSSSVKASLVDIDNGRAAASAFYPDHEAPIISVKSGWAEQDLPSRS